ncbi:alpha-1B-glycoprotein-like [Tenrec ecaudatus]|uniref:alpha-1B-glycoprotein-like n=1 Tax=Tenrec ecaudatus TaxID=94439 RepID=UPI003F5944A9
MGRTPTKLCSGSLRDWRGEDSGTALLTVLLQLVPPEKSTLFFEVESLEHPWDNVTLICRSPNKAQAFQLLKDGVAQDPVHLRPHAREHRFPLGKVTEDTRGIYRCKHTSNDHGTTQISDLVEVTGRGSLPKPKLSLVSEGLTLTPGSEGALRCQGSLTGAIFLLLQEKARRPLQAVSSTGNSADFRIPELTAQDSRKYRCLYLRTRHGTSGSWLSNALELSVAGLLPKPLLWSVWSDTVTAGRDAKLQCLSPLPDMHFELLRAGAVLLHNWGSADNYVADFTLSNVGPQDAGNYSCRYSPRESHSATWSEDSDPLALRVQREEL